MDSVTVTQQEKNELMECFIVKTRTDFMKALTLMAIIYGSALVVFLK